MEADQDALLARYRELLAGDTHHLFRSIGDLPGDKQAIAAAIKHALRRLAAAGPEASEPARSQLKSQYAQLAFFVPDDRLLGLYEREIRDGISGVGDEWADIVEEHDRLVEEIERYDGQLRAEPS